MPFTLPYLPQDTLLSWLHGKSDIFKLWALSYIPECFSAQLILLSDVMKLLILHLSVTLCWLSVQGQHHIAFRHLNTSNGLSYQGVSDMCVDQKGNLWIGTGNGLNMFNGKTVDKYFATEFPQLQNSNVIHVTSDRHDRIWVLTANGNVTIIDEKRKFHRAGLYDESGFLRTRWILESKQGDPILFTSAGHYILSPDVRLNSLDSLTMDQFIRLEIRGFDTLQPLGYRQVFYFDDDHYLFVRDDCFYKVDYREKVVERKYEIPHCTALVKLDDVSLMAYDQASGDVTIIDLETATVTYPFRTLYDQYGLPVKAVFMFAEKINDHEIILTTQRSGIYRYDQTTRKIYNYRHHYADGSSIGSNAASTLEVHPSGWVFITCNPAGISYYNTREITYSQPVFIDEKGDGYDGYIAGIATKDNETYYVGTGEGLLKWNRNTNVTHFLHYRDNQGNPLPAPQEIASIVIDRLDQVWVATLTQGLLVLDHNSNLLRQITDTGPKKFALKMSRINRLKAGPDGWIWATGRNGMCRINPATFEVDHFEKTPLAAFDSLFCTMIEFIDSTDLWVAISPAAGVRHCHLPSGQIRRYTTEEGLVHNSIFDLGSDAQKNIYVATRDGLSIMMKDGRIKTLTQKDGLLMNRAEGILRDRHNRIWIGNDIGLACFTPEDSSLATFDARYGLSIFGFRVGSYFSTPNGEFIFGTPHGLQYFHPDSLYNKSIAFTTLIHKIESKNISAHISGTESFSLSPDDRQVTFHFSTVDFSPQVRMHYQYRLTGIDHDWISIVDQQAVRYTGLPPGDYVFKVRVSHNNRQWQEADNEVHLHIASPLYRTWWFLLSCGLILTAVAWLAGMRVRNKQISRREQLETESVIHYFASQINGHKQVDELLWDVAQNCISHLNLQECVIYMVDHERQVLVQKAAFGPKNPHANVIYKPIEIPVGHGITGTVALTQNAEIINNTERDGRYILDDSRRLSEIAVPIAMEGRILGVIDSEHTQKNFFTPRHMSILSTVAVLCANQIQRILAEEEKHKAQIEILQNRQKVIESRLQSLRLQMNPHFLFNALNSIQQMILANEELVATRYLSRFSKLLRSILIHSDKETISLREEIEILRLYVELESVRFKDAFTYTIDCDAEIDPDEVKIPTLLIQPFVENAIWHGLMHKEGDRNLKIIFTDMGEYVKCIVEDNGIGRQKAREIKISSGQDKKHTSKGIEVSLERLKAMQKNGNTTGRLDIIDLVDDEGRAQGTRVEIHIPIQN